MLEQPSALRTIPKLSSMLKSKIEKLDIDLEREWVQYIKDHRADLIAVSTLYTIPPDTINMYLYRPQDYLKEVHSLPNSATWIFLYLNNLTSYLDFNRDLYPVFITPYKSITELRQMFVVFRSNREKNDKVIASPKV